MVTTLMLEILIPFPVILGYDTQNQNTSAITVSKTFSINQSFHQARAKTTKNL